jgi:hypothetical protein
LYVDVTRVRHRDNIRVLVEPNRIIRGVPHTLNIVYREFTVSVYLSMTVHNWSLLLS